MFDIPPRKFSTLPHLALALTLTLISTWTSTRRKISVFESFLGRTEVITGASKANKREEFDGNVR